MAAPWPLATPVLEAALPWNEQGAASPPPSGAGDLVYVWIDGDHVGCPVRTHDGQDWVDREVAVNQGAGWVPAGQP